MRIGVDALYLIPGEVGGTERYLRCLLAEMARQAPEDSFYIFIGREAAGSFGEPAGTGDEGPGLYEIPAPAPSRVRTLRAAYEQLFLPALCARRRLDVLFCPGYSAPLAYRGPVVTTVHDLQHRLRPENYRPWERAAYRLLVDPAIRRSDLLLAVSETSAADIQRVYGIGPDRVRVTLLAPEESFRSPIRKEILQARLNALGVRRPYLLCVASLLPHKGFDTLLGAYAELVAGGLEHRLVLAGFFGHHTPAVKRLIGELGLHGKVRLLGWVDSCYMPALYAGADLLVVPSTFEGFGLPLVEAMARGVPVLARRAKSIPEVAGEAACYFDGTAPGLAREVRRLLHDEVLRRRLVREGRERSKLFTWEETARRTLEALREAAGRGV